MENANGENDGALGNARAFISKAASIAGRDPSEVTLVAVSKMREPAEIVPLLEQGQRVFGENRVQEAAAKWPQLKAAYSGVELHLIGQLQSNKAEDAATLFDCIHSVDRLSLIKALGKAFGKAGRNPPCFLQVNIGEEEQKGGCAIDDIDALLASAETHGVNIVGLMCLPPADVEPAPYFALLGELAHRAGLSQLSMGMSADYESAVQLGATHIRIGTALFGPRK